jgi:heme A synthase
MISLVAKMYEVVIKLHYVVSAIFIILALVTTVWALIGWVKDLPCPRSFLRLSWVFIHFLYIQFLTGITLYFFLKPEADLSLLTMEEALEHNSTRFWGIEHVSLMLFALILSQVGRLIIKQISNDRKKYRAATFYYGISLLVVMSSAFMAIFKNL